jgi:hypothetical protein
MLQGGCLIRCIGWDVCGFIDGVSFETSGSAFVVIRPNPAPIMRNQPGLDLESPSQLKRRVGAMSQADLDWKCGKILYANAVAVLIQEVSAIRLERQAQTARLYQGTCLGGCLQPYFSDYIPRVK